MAHYRLKLLSERDRHFRHALSSLVKSGLYRGVLHVELIGYGYALVESLGSFLLLPSYHVEVSCKSRDNLRRPRPILPHILENRSQHVNVAQFVKPVEKHKKSLVGTLFECFVELLGVQSRSLDDFVVLLEHIHNHLGNGSCRHLHRLSLAIQDGSKSHDFGDGHFRLGTHASHALRKIGEIRSRCRAVLRKLVDDRTHGKKSLLRSHALLVTEDACQFGESKRCPLSEVVQSHIDLVSGTDKAEDILLRGLAEPSCFLCEFVQILSGSSGVNLLELLVEFLHLRSRKSRKLADVSHFLVHIRKGVYCGASRHDDARYRSRDAGKSRLPIVKLSVHALPQALVVAKLAIDLGDFSLHTLDSLTLAVPFLAATLQAIQVPFELCEGSVEFLG